MFEELEEDSPDVTPDSPDRHIAWAIATRVETSITSDEAWAILHDRYPDDPRFLVLHVYAELNQRKRELEEGQAKGDTLWTSGYLVTKLERVVTLAKEDLHLHIRELLMFGSQLLADAKDDEQATLRSIRTKVGAETAEVKRDDRDRAGIRLRRFEREILKEIDERTAENLSIGIRAAAPAVPEANAWADAVADKAKPRRKYAADSRFERGELIEHPKFGVGLVTGIEPGKVNILFETGSRKLVAGA